MFYLDSLFMAQAHAFPEYNNLRGDLWALAGARNAEEAVRNQEQWASERAMLMALNLGGDEE